MSNKIVPSLENVSETLLIPLYARALETQRPDALIRDDLAIDMVRQLDCDFSRYMLKGHDAISILLRVREFDRKVQEFLARNPKGVVIHIGCGLDTRFERVDNGSVEWFDMDVPAVMSLRKRLVVSNNPRCHPLSCSVLDEAWIEELAGYSQRPMLFIAEAVFPYFTEEQVRSLVLRLSSRFPGCELVCDAHTPFMIWADNLHLAVLKLSARLHWGLKHGKDIENWGSKIKLLEEWFYFDDPEPRMRPYRWMRFIPALGRSTGIFHYRLG